MIITIPLARDSKLVWEPASKKNSPSRPSKEKDQRKPRKRCRTGCITCRIRRVKCDEAKPACVKCTSTGRKCDGYQPATLVKSEKVSTSPTSAPAKQSLVISQELKSEEVIESVTKPPLKPQSLSILRNPSTTAHFREQRSLEYYCRRTASNLSGYFDSSFWSSVVLQLSNVEPSIRHGLLALSSLHEGVEVGGDIHIRNERNLAHQHYALQQYNAAVVRIRQLIDDRSTQVLEVTLTACLIFTSHELMQYNYNMAIKHLMAGLTLLCAEPETQINPGLRDLFSRILMQTVFLGAPYVELQYLPNQLQRSWGSFLRVSDARDALQDTFFTIYPFLWQVANDDNIKLEELESRHKELTQTVHAWYAMYQKFVALHRASFTPKDQVATTLLYVHYICLTIILATAPGPEYASFSTMTPCFIRIVSVIDGILGPIDQSDISAKPHDLPHLPNFSLEHGILAPLFYTAIKCRSSPVRWEAISLLKHPRIPLREGIWGAPMTARMAQRVVELEEEMAIEKGLPMSEIEMTAMGNMAGERRFWDLTNLNKSGEVMKEGDKDKPDICYGEGVDLEWKSKHPVAAPEERVLRLFIGGRGEKRDRWREELVTW